MEWGRRRKTSCQAALLLKRSHFRAGLTRTRGGHTINFPASKSRQSLFRILINKRVSQRERMNGNAFFSDQALTPMTTRKRGFRNHFFFKTLKSSQFSVKACSNETIISLSGMMNDAAAATTAATVLDWQPADCSENFQTRHALYADRLLMQGLPV
jgi:hypothetical protein